MFGLYISEMRKIGEFPVSELNSETIDNCFFVENMNTSQVKKVPVSKIIDRLLERAEEKGLKIELLDGKVMFIHK